MQRHPETNSASRAGKQGELATDLARLFSLNNVEEVAYLDFSRERAEHRGQRLTDKMPAVPQEVAALIVEAEEKAVPVVKDASPAPQPPRLELTSRTHPVQPAPATFSPSAESRTVVLTPAPEPAVVLPISAPEPIPSPRAMNHGGPNLSLSPGLAVYSIAGGVGKSTVCANLARALHDRGERILLVDANGLGMLPLHFGADEMHTGLRRFRAPGESQASILVASDENPGGDWLRHNVEPLMQRVSRTIFDLSAANDSFLDEALPLCQIMLVPLLPDLSSLLTLIRMASRLKKLQGLGLTSPKVQYILNRYDSANEAHRKAKDMILSQIGDDLLTVSLPASDDLGEAFTQRMTIADLAPTSPLAKSYAELAKWLRDQAPPFSNPDAARWSEL